MKNKKGFLPILAGLLLLSGALGLTVYNISDSRRAEESVSRIVEQFVLMQPSDQTNTAEENIPLYVRYPEMEMPVTQMDGMYYIGILELPTLGLKLPVLSELTDDNLTVAPCRYAGSAYLDNLVIAAHNYTSHFGTLRDIAYGDRIVFTDADGNVFKYTVAEIEMLAPEDIEEMESGNWDLSLFTCTVGGGSRVTVRCEKTE